MTWDDARYLAFADERTRPAAELLGRVPLSSAELVVDLGCGPGNSTAHARAVDVWQTTYQHVMADVSDIVRWVTATGMRPYLDALTAEERARYLTDYAAALELAYPQRADGKRLFAFERLFVVATR